MTIIKDPQIQQALAIEHSNKYIDSTLSNLGGMAQKQALVSAYDDEDASDPIFKMFLNVGSLTDKLSGMLKGINADTTMTEDAASLVQANAVDKAMDQFDRIISIGKADTNNLESSVSSQLFSRSAMLTPETMALLGNDTLMKEMRDNYLGFADNERSAVLLNTFNKFGTMGDSEKAAQIDTALDRRHSPVAVATLKRIGEQHKTIGILENEVKKAYTLLVSDPEKIASIRSRKFA